MNPTAEWLARPGGLADRLHTLRKAAGLTGERLAQDLGWVRSKVSKLENGRQMPTADDIAAWTDACGAPEAKDELLEMLAAGAALHRQHRHELRFGQVALQGNLDELVRNATVVRNFETVLVPGLLQTAEYARYRVLENVRVYGGAEQEVDAATAARIHRQAVLYDTTKRYEFVITEAVLRILLCPPPVMRGQLDRLLGLVGLPHIKFGVIPLGVELSIAPLHGFLMLDDVTYIESFASEIVLRGEESQAYERIAEGLMAEAATGEDARRLITQAAGLLET